jgi:hypothetical protein
LDGVVFEHFAFLFLAEEAAETTHIPLRATMLFPQRFLKRLLEKTTELQEHREQSHGQSNNAQEVQKADP